MLANKKELVEIANKLILENIDNADKQKELQEHLKDATKKQIQELIKQLKVIDDEAKPTTESKESKQPFTPNNTGSNTILSSTIEDVMDGNKTMPKQKEPQKENHLKCDRCGRSYRNLDQKTCTNPDHSWNPLTLIKK